MKIIKTEEDSCGIAIPVLRVVEGNDMSGGIYVHEDDFASILVILEGLASECESRQPYILERIEKAVGGTKLFKELRSKTRENGVWWDTLDP